MSFKAFATDYDGTLAHHASVDPATIDVITQLRETGVRTLLVTGREIPDLATVFSECSIFDLIVGENGALLYWPHTKVERLLAEPPPQQFADYLRTQGVKDLSVGKVIVATMESYIDVVRAGIHELELNLEIILNKGSLMVLPRGINKGFGLNAAARELGVKTAEIAAVGDAENDLSFLRAAGFGAAVANALPELKAEARWIARGGHGAGVRELIEYLWPVARAPSSQFQGD
jgi:hydroxymethylpyrimidine pyrophosphatase-like HAD family hydrolase